MDEKVISINKIEYERLLMIEKLLKLYFRAQIVIQQSRYKKALKEVLG